MSKQVRYTASDGKGTTSWGTYDFDKVSHSEYLEQEKVLLLFLENKTEKRVQYNAQENPQGRPQPAMKWTNLNTEIYLTEEEDIQYYLSLCANPMEFKFPVKEETKVEDIVPEVAVS
jgi:hypothetical protein